MILYSFLGDKVTVGAGSVVTKSVREGCAIVMGYLAHIVEI